MLNIQNFAKYRISYCRYNRTVRAGVTLASVSSRDFGSLVVGTENERCVLKRARALWIWFGGHPIEGRQTGKTSSKVSMTRGDRKLALVWHIQQHVNNTPYLSLSDPVNNISAKHSIYATSYIITQKIFILTILV